MIITADSHLDHGLTVAHIAYLLKEFQGRTEFFRTTVDLPPELDAVPCGLYGPTTDHAPVRDGSDPVHYARRGDRSYNSRLVKWPLRQTRQLSVIAGPHNGHTCVLYTAFGGPISPREPLDPSITSDTEKAESEAFWADHALAAG